MGLLEKLPYLKNSLPEVITGAISGALSGWVVTILSNRFDKKEAQRVSLEMVKIKVEEYKKNSDYIGFAMMQSPPRDDEKTQEVREKIQVIKVKIKEHLIHCPKNIRERTMDFFKLCNGKNQKLEMFALEFKLNSKKTVDITEEQEKVERSYSDLIREIDKCL